MKQHPIVHLLVWMCLTDRPFVEELTASLKRLEEDKEVSPATLAHSDCEKAAGGAAATGTDTELETGSKAGECIDSRKQNR
jgi:hypothetical protein